MTFSKIKFTKPNGKKKKLAAARLFQLTAAQRASESLQHKNVLPEFQDVGKNTWLDHPWPHQWIFFKGFMNLRMIKRKGHISFSPTDGLGPMALLCHF